MTRCPYYAPACVLCNGMAQGTAVVPLGQKAARVLRRAGRGVLFRIKVPICRACWIATKGAPAVAVQHKISMRCDIAKG